VLLDTPVARESCGEAAIYARSAAPSDVGPALAEALFDETSRTRIAAAAPGVLRRYDWPRAARETLAAIETA
jgi:hypothetical protein